MKHWQLPTTTCAAFGNRVPNSNPKFSIIDFRFRKKAAGEYIHTHLRFEMNSFDDFNQFFFFFLWKETCYRPFQIQCTLQTSNWWWIGPFFLNLLSREKRPIETFFRAYIVRYCMIFLSMSILRMFQIVNYVVCLVIDFLLLIRMFVS